MKMKLSTLIGTGLMMFAARDVFSTQNVLLHTEIVTREHGRAVVEEIVPARGAVSFCAGELRSHTPYEPRSDGQEHLIDGAFCDGFVIQASLIAERPSGVAIKWVIHADGLSPVSRSVSASGYFQYGDALAMPLEKCHLIGARSIMMSISPLMRGAPNEGGGRRHAKDGGQA